MENKEEEDYGIKSPWQKFTEFYSGTSKKIKMLDSLIVLTAFLAMQQLFYYLIGGKNPFEGFISGLFCSLAVMVLTGTELSSVS